MEALLSNEMALWVQFLCTIPVSPQHCLVSILMAQYSRQSTKSERREIQESVMQSHSANYWNGEGISHFENKPSKN